MAINWGPISGSDIKQGRLGIEFIYSQTDTTFTVNARLYYRTRYSVDDGANTFYYDWDSHADTSLGAKKIAHKNNSNWNEANITHIGTFTKTFTKTSKSQTGYFSGRFTNVEYGGGSGSHYLPFTVPALGTYVVRYNANGGTGAPNDQIKIHGQRLILSYRVPTRPGYVFIGWGSHPNATTPINRPEGAYDGNMDYTFYAVWKRSSDIAVKVNGTYRRGLAYVKVNGQYKRGTVYVKKNGVYKRGI